MKKGLVFNVGPLTNVYTGPHTYSDVLFPFVKELTRRKVSLTWAGITLENTISNEKLKDLGIYKKKKYLLDIRNDVEHMSVSWDFIDATEFDFFLCQPRPDMCEIENIILNKLIQKFLDAGKKVFIWEQDMFISGFTTEMKEKAILLHPAVLPTGKFKHEIYFPFFTYDRDDYEELTRDLDFLFIGNIYGRQPQAIQFFEPLNDAKFNKLVFGSWIQDEERRKFSSQFDQFEFAGKSEHWSAIPTMRRAKATLHIVPDFAKIRGLMTARVFTSQMSRCLCFCDSKIYGARQFFPDELIVDNGTDIVDRWEYVQENREALLTARDALMKEHTVQNRVQQFLSFL